MTFTVPNYKFYIWIVLVSILKIRFVKVGFNYFYCRFIKIEPRTQFLFFFEKGSHFVDNCPAKKHSLFMCSKRANLSWVIKPLFLICEDVRKLCQLPFFHFCAFTPRLPRQYCFVSFDDIIFKNFYKKILRPKCILLMAHNVNRQWDCIRSCWTDRKITGTDS